MAGRLHPDGGTMAIDGRSSGERLPELLRDIYFVPEEYDLPNINLSTYVDINAPFCRDWLPQLFRHMDMLNIPIEEVEKEWKNHNNATNNAEKA